MSTVHQFHVDGEIPIHNEVFVFGSNLAGRHGKGAALIAKNMFGAKHGLGEGYSNAGFDKFQQHSYAIPTKDRNLNVLDLVRIHESVVRFIDYANKNPDMNFYVTRIGCGLAGYKDNDIAPLFKECPMNVIFPENWKEYLPSI